MRSKLTIHFLDAATVDLGDLNLNLLKKQGHYTSLPLCSDDKIVRKARKADVLIINKCVLTREQLLKLPKLKLICVAATGINNVDLKAAQELKITVTNVANYSTTTVAEHTLLFLLAFAHRLQEHHGAVTRGDWSRSPHFTLLDFPFSDLAEKTLGIIGYGHIGKRVEKISKALGMKILVAKIPGRKYSDNKKRTSLNTILKKSDYITLHCPLNHLTHHLMNKNTLRLMKKSAVLINMARGPLVNEADVANALKKNNLRGYGTDVMAQEPPSSKNPLFHSSLKNKVLLTPHIAWGSRESRQRLLDEIAGNIAAFRKGKTRNRVV